MDKLFLNCKKQSERLKTMGNLAEAQRRQMHCLDLNGEAHDGFASLRSMQFRLDLLVQQLPTMEEIQSGQPLVEIWKEQYHKLHMGLRNANFQAKANIKKAAEQEVWVLRKAETVLIAKVLLPPCEINKTSPLHHINKRSRPTQGKSTHLVPIKSEPKKVTSTGTIIGTSKARTQPTK